MSEPSPSSEIFDNRRKPALPWGTASDTLDPASSETTNITTGSEPSSKTSNDAQIKSQSAASQRGTTCNLNFFITQYKAKADELREVRAELAAVKTNASSPPQGPARLSIHREASQVSSHEIKDSKGLSMFERLRAAKEAATQPVASISSQQHDPQLTAEVERLRLLLDVEAKAKVKLSEQQKKLNMDLLVQNLKLKTELSKAQAQNKPPTHTATESTLLAQNLKLKAELSKAQAQNKSSKQTATESTLLAQNLKLKTELAKAQAQNKSTPQAATTSTVEAQKAARTISMQAAMIKEKSAAVQALGNELHSLRKQAPKNGSRVPFPVVPLPTPAGPSSGQRKVCQFLTAVSNDLKDCISCSRPFNVEFRGVTEDPSSRRLILKCKSCGTTCLEEKV